MVAPDRQYHSGLFLVRQQKEEHTGVSAVSIAHRQAVPARRISGRHGQVRVVARERAGQTIRNPGQ
jgi:IMP cyclohydrolase